MRLLTNLIQIIDTEKENDIYYNFILIIPYKTGGNDDNEN